LRQNFQYKEKLMRIRINQSHLLHLDHGGNRN